MSPAPRSATSPGSAGSPPPRPARTAPRSTRAADRAAHAARKPASPALGVDRPRHRAPRAALCCPWALSVVKPPDGDLVVAAGGDVAPGSRSVAEHRRPRAPLVEEIAEACDRAFAPRWFQLYWSKDRDVAAELPRTGGGGGVRDARSSRSTRRAWGLAAAGPRPARSCRSSTARATRVTFPIPSSGTPWATTTARARSCTGPNVAAQCRIARVRSSSPTACRKTGRKGSSGCPRRGGTAGTRGRGPAAASPCPPCRA